MSLSLTSNKENNDWILLAIIVLFVMVVLKSMQMHASSYYPAAFISFDQ